MQVKYHTCQFDIHFSVHPESLFSVECWQGSCMVLCGFYSSHLLYVIHWDELCENFGRALNTYLKQYCFWVTARHCYHKQV